MNEPLTPGHAPRPEMVLFGVLPLIALLVAGGFLVPMPFGLGGWELVIVAAPVALAAVALAALLRAARVRRAAAPDRPA